MSHQMNLTDLAGKTGAIPLAERARPEHLDEMRGHHKLLGPGTTLRVMLENDEYSSFILWGPPGCGKTTIARLIENSTSHSFSSFSAVLSKIGTVKELMEKAERRLHTEGRKTIVFIDEIHRFNKSQQDAFLPYVESGAIILFGATTESPSFEVIPALISRCHVFRLSPLEKDDIENILRHATSLFARPPEIDPAVYSLIAEQCGGDARRAINTLEMICRKVGSNTPVVLDTAREALTTRSPFYDKNGEEHYNLISAFQKSIRGSDPQAALYWMARMLQSGEDPMYLVRRLARIASEDIGLADPQAIVQAMAVKEAVHFLGMPEANTALTQLVIYLATAPKSNRCEVAYFAAEEDVRKTSHLRVPLHICNAPTRIMKDLGYGKGYRYDHDAENSYSYQKYFPDEMKEKEYYSPSSFGFEKEIKKRLDWWNRLKAEQLKKNEE